VPASAPFVGAGIDMPVGIDEPGHGGHAFGVDRRANSGGWPTRRSRNDFFRRGR